MIECMYCLEPVPNALAYDGCFCSEDCALAYDYVLALNSNAELEQLRARLEAAFSSETAYPGTATENRSRSAGQCAAVSAIVWARFGGEFVSAIVHGQSHWFNRLHIGDRVIDVDLTGDQFGLQPVRFGEPGSLWPATRTRSVHELREETVQRAIRLAERAGLQDEKQRLLDLLDCARLERENT